MEQQIFDITAYGAVGNGATDNTAAIQKAIDECTEGGIVKIPEGTFVSGAIYLKSNMTLDLAEGAVLLGSGHPEKYPIMVYRFEGLETNCYASLINTREGKQENISITGKGTIDANGMELFQKEMAENAGKRGRAVCLRKTSNILIQGVTIRQSPCWCLHLIYSDNIIIENVEIHTKYDAEGNVYKDIYNGDGVDIDSCRNVIIRHSLIASQDDNIAIKSGRDEEGRRVGIPTENVEIHDCIFRYGFGVAMGSEMSGDIRNVSVHDCTFEDTYCCGSIKARRGRGAVVENIDYARITHYNHSLEHKDCKWFRGSLYIDLFYSLDEYDSSVAEPVTDGTPHFRNLTFTDVTSETWAGNGVFICGLPESPIQNVAFRNVHVAAKNGIVIHNVENFDCENFTQELLD